MDTVIFLADFYDVFAFYREVSIGLYAMTSTKSIGTGPGRLE